MAFSNDKSEHMFWGHVAVCGWDCSFQTCVQVCFDKCSCTRVYFKEDKNKKRMEPLKNRPFSIPRYRHMISIGNKLVCKYFCSSYVSYFWSNLYKTVLGKQSRQAKKIHEKPRRILKSSKSLKKLPSLYNSHKVVGLLNTLYTSWICW